MDYLNAESAYQAQKSPKNAHLFTQLSGYEAKKMGYKVLMVANWNDTKLQIMYNIVSEKFAQNTYLQKKLLATGDAILIEGNTWRDTFWGVCNGVGENWLGLILMRVRDELKLESEK